MRSLRILAFIALAMMFAPMAFAADFGVRAGRYHDADEEFVGAEVVFDLGAINVNPNIEYSLQDHVTAGSVNLDVTYDVIHIGPASPYVGAGVGLSYFDPEVGTNQTDVVGNLIGGVSFNLGLLQPYAQAKYFRILQNDTGRKENDVALTVGLRF